MLQYTDPGRSPRVRCSNLLENAVCLRERGLRSTEAYAENGCRLIAATGTAFARRDALVSADEGNRASARRVRYDERVATIPIGIRRSVAEGEVKAIPGNPCYEDRSCVALAFPRYKGIAQIRGAWIGFIVPGRVWRCRIGLWLGRRSDSAATSAASADATADRQAFTGRYAVLLVCGAGRSRRADARECALDGHVVCLPLVRQAGFPKDVIGSDLPWVFSGGPRCRHPTRSAMPCLDARRVLPRCNVSTRRPQPRSSRDHRRARESQLRQSLPRIPWSGHRELRMVS